jgi:tight adherence protein C
MASGLVLLMGLLAVCAAVALTAAALAPAFAAKRQVSRSLAAVSADVALVSPHNVSLRQRVVVPAFEQLGELGYRLSPRGAVERLQRQLDLAGNPAGWNVQRVLAAKAGGLLLLALAASWFCSSTGASGVRTLTITVAAGAGGFFLPDLLTYNAGTKRQDAMKKQLADSLDLLTVCVESGLGFDAALVQVARSTTGPLSAEFHRTLQEMQIGKSRMDALRGMSERSTLADLRVFVGAIVQADSLGIPIARVLREQSKEMRLKRRQRAEEKAMKVPVKVLFPTVVFILPVIFVVIIGPAAIQMSQRL